MLIDNSFQGGPSRAPWELLEGKCMMIPWPLWVYQHHQFGGFPNPIREGFLWRFHDVGVTVSVIGDWLSLQSHSPSQRTEDGVKSSSFLMMPLCFWQAVPIKSHLGAPNHQSSRYYTKGTLITPQCQGFQEPYQKPGDQDQFISIIPQSPSLLSSQSYSFSSSHVRMRETTKKAECWRIDAFKLWCWKRLLRVP